MDNTNSTNKSINEEILDNLVVQVNALEKREVKLPNYNERFNTIEKLIIQSIPDYNKPIENLQAAVSQHNLAYPAEEIKAQINTLRNEVACIPKVIPVRNYHHVDVKTKPFMITGSLLLIFVAISTGLSIHLWVENSRLHVNDIKCRMTRQIFPIQAKAVDSFYAKTPVKMEQQTVQFETEALERSKAADIAEQKAREAKEAKDKLNELQKHKH